MPRTSVTLIVAAVVLVHAAPAQAFVCTASSPDTGAITIVWKSRCIPYAIDEGSKVLESDAAKQVVADSFAEWSSQSCTDLTFLNTGPTTQGANFDPAEPLRNRNVLDSVDSRSELDQLIRDGLWEDERQVAVTLTRFSPITGEIVDADILFNSVGFEFGIVSDPMECGPMVLQHDLQNTLVHEIGHLIGLDHTPDMEATMFAAAEGCEIIKRDLAADDLDGLCTVYPAGQDAMTCVPPPGNDYSPFGTNPQPFRDQCDRGSETGSGGCSCKSAPMRDEQDGASIAVVALLLFCLTRRRAT